MDVSSWRNSMLFMADDFLQLSKPDDLGHVDASENVSNQILEHWPALSPKKVFYLIIRRIRPSKSLGLDGMLPVPLTKVNCFLPILDTGGPMSFPMKDSLMTLPFHN